MDAGTGMIILSGGTVGARDDNASIVLKAEDYIHLNTGSAIVSGARFAEDGFTPIKTGNDATLSIQTSGELKISGSVTAAGRMDIQSGSSTNDFADYFDTLPGKKLASIADAAKIDAIVAALNSGAVSSDLRALFVSASLNLGDTVGATSVTNYNPFSALSDEAKTLVAETLGYTVYTDGGFYNAATNTFRASLSEGPTLSSSAGYTYYAGMVFYNADAPAGSALMTGFTQGESSDYSNALIDWAAAGVSAPAANATFEQLTAAQKVVAANSIGYLFDYNGISTTTWAAGFTGAESYAQIPFDKWVENARINTPRFPTTPGAPSATITARCRMRPGWITTSSTPLCRPAPGGRCISSPT
jgi:hypothetical protein